MECFSTIEERAEAYAAYFGQHMAPLGQDTAQEGQRNLPVAESRNMEGDFGTLLCLYGQDGMEWSFSRKGMRTARHQVPHQGKYHKHGYIEVFYVIKGSFEQILLGEMRHFEKGEAVITDQNCEHADYLTGEEGAVLFLLLKPDYLDSLLESYDAGDELQRFLFHALGDRKKEQSFLELKYQAAWGNEEINCADGVGRILEQLVKEDYDRQPGCEEIIRGNLIRLLNHLCTGYSLQRYSNDRQSREKVLLYEIERYIRLHASSVSAAELEQNFHYHRNYYNLLLKKYRCKSLKKYIQEVRLAQAKVLLRDTAFPVKEVAHRAGYENTGFFYRLFERSTGFSPLEYREQESYSVGKRMKKNLTQKEERS